MPPKAPDGTGRDLWYNVKPVHPEVFDQHEAGPWLRAEDIQAAFRKGAEDEADEQYQRDWEKRKVKEEEVESLKRARAK